MLSSRECRKPDPKSQLRKKIVLQKVGRRHCLRPFNVFMSVFCLLMTFVFVKPAISGWKLESIYDLKIAIVREQSEATLGLFYNEDRAIYIMITLPAGSPGFDKKKSPEVRVDKGNNFIKIVDSIHPDPIAITWEVVKPGEKPSQNLFLKRLISGNRVYARCFLKNGKHVDLKFSLKGSKRAITKLLSK